MPIIKSAIKRMKQTVVRRARNVETKKSIKAATKALAATPSSTNLSKAQSEIDKAVKKGLLKKNTAARRKAKLAADAKKAGVKLEKSSAKKAAPKAAAKKPAAKKAPAKKPAAKKASK